MSWICPKCSRQFKNPNQWHSCEKNEIASVMENKPKEIVVLYHALAVKVKALGPVTIEATRSAVMFKAPATFLAFKPKKDGAIIEFFLPEARDEFPVFRVLRISRKRWVHIVTLENEKDLNQKVIGWINESYGLLRK